MRPLSDVRAKAALPIAGQPLIGRILRWLHAAGIRRAVINLHHKPDTVTRLIGDGAPWGMQVRYSWEREVLGSAGGPKRALPLLDATRFLIVNGDTLTDCDLLDVAHQHIATGARVTMALVPRRVDRAVLTDREGIVIGFGPGETHFIGVQAVNADVFDGVPDDQPYEVVKQLYPDLIRECPGSVRAYHSQAEFLDVGTPADYFHAVETIASREGRDLDRGEGTIVHPAADVRRTILWDRVSVEHGAALTDCIVADDVVIPAGGRYERCAIVRHGSVIKAARF